MNKILNLIIPSVVIIVLSAGVYWILNCFGEYRLYFSIEEMKNDIQQLFFLGEEMYYAYQLWYICSMLRCYILGSFVFVCLGKARRLKHFIYMVCTITFFIMQSVAYFSVIVGMIVADYEDEVIKKGIKIKKSASLALFLSMIAPFMYNEQNLGSINKMILALVIACVFFLLLVTEANVVKTFEKKGKIVDWLDVNSYSFYLVHVLILNLLSYPLYEFLMNKMAKYEVIVLIINYLVSMFVGWCVAYLFNNFVIKKIKLIL